MGGRGTFASGKQVPYTYETIGKINGVKVLQKIDPKASKGLPEEAHSSSAYILKYSNGTFKQIRFYNDDHTAKYDIDYHFEPKLGSRKEPVYHIHEYRNGVRDKVGRLLTKSEYEKYKVYFIGGNSQ